MSESEQYKTELAALQSRFEKWISVLEGDRPKERAVHCLLLLTAEMKSEFEDKQKKDVAKVKEKHLAAAEEMSLLVEYGSTNTVIAAHICSEKVRRCEENQVEGEAWARQTWSSFLSE